MASVVERPDSAMRRLQGVLAAVRRRIRLYVAVEGLATTVAVAALAVWLMLAVDWLFEPPGPVRLALVGLAAVAVVVIFYRRFLRRTFARLADRNIALVLERKFRGLNDSLLTAVEVDEAQLPESGRSMLAATRRSADERLIGMSLASLFDVRPRRQAVVAALLTAGALAAFAFAAPDLLQLGVARLLARTDEPWPRRTGLSIDGFKNGELVVAEGSQVELTVRADMQKVVPHRVELRYRTDDGVRELVDMEQEGIAKLGVDTHQRFKFAFHGVSSSMTLDVFGGDARLRNLKIRVEPRPQLRLQLACVYPAYTRRADNRLDVTGSVPVPQGTLVTVMAESNKPLSRVVAKRSSAAGEESPQTIDLGAANNKFQIPIGRLDADLQITFALYDLDGIDNTTKLSLQAVVDQPPALAVARKGVDVSVTPQARLPMVGKINDDYGLGRLWFEVGVDGAPSTEVLMKGQASGAREAVVAEALELPDLFGSSRPLVVGQALTVVTMARDERRLHDQPQGNVAAGDVQNFTIVSDDELLRMLEAREIMYREQFKALIDKVTRDRDSLVSVGTVKPAEPAAGGTQPTVGEAPAVKPDVVIVGQARSHGKENRAETLAVSVGVSTIVEELDNNRVASGENLRHRLAVEVAAPLSHIGTQLFADYEAKLTALALIVNRTTIDPAERDAARAASIQAADAILVEMNIVLNKMQALENFKEAVDLLRAIIAMQNEIGDATKKQRSGKLRLLQE